MTWRFAGEGKPWRRLSESVTVVVDGGWSPCPPRIPKGVTCAKYSSAPGSCCANGRLDNTQPIQHGLPLRSSPVERHAVPLRLRCERRHDAARPRGGPYSTPDVQNERDLYDGSRINHIPSSGGKGCQLSAGARQLFTRCHSAAAVAERVLRRTPDRGRGLRSRHSGGVAARAGPRGATGRRSIRTQKPGRAPVARHWIRLRPGQRPGRAVARTHSTEEEAC